MTSQTSTHPKRFVSLRFKLLVGFTLLFSVVFAGAFYWFYTFATDRALQRIQEDLQDTLRGTLAGIDGDTFAALARDAKPDASGVPTTDPRYLQHQAWLGTIHQIEPRANPYTYVKGPETNQVLWIGDILRVIRPEDGTKFLEPYISRGSLSLIKGLSDETLNLKPYTDKWGSWVSAYAPIRDLQGNIVGAVGIDFRADYVFQVQQAIRDQVVVAFLITYGMLFLLVFLISQFFTRPITNLTKAAERIGEGSPVQAFSSDTGRFRDEIATLADTLSTMVDQIAQRERELREQAEREKILLLKTSQFKSEFLTHMSHEMRTPLTAIKGLADLALLGESEGISEQLQKDFQTIRRNCLALLGIIDDVLDMSKIEAGQFSLKVELIDLRTVIADVLETTKSLAHQKGLGLRQTVAEGDLTVTADRQRIRQALLNLVGNAIKFTEHGEISIHAERENGVIRLSVRDTGPGIPPDQLEAIFQPFHQLEVTATRASGGAGLGLPISRHLVELHGGRLWVENLEKGTAFYIELPLKGGLG